MSSRSHGADHPTLRWVRHAPGGISPRGEARQATPPPARVPHLGVLGGTFNPVTLGHLELAERAQVNYALDEVLFLVPERLPHRQPEEATLEQRVMLLEVALARSDRFSLAVSSHGLFLDMARAIEPAYPAATRMFFLVGNDAAHRILGWNYQDRAEAWKEMFARFDLIVATRAGELQIPTDPELQPYAGQIHSLTLGPDVQQVSATAARERVRTGRPLTGLVAPEVAAAIERWQLYRSG